MFFVVYAGSGSGQTRTQRVKYDCTLSAEVEISGLGGHWGGVNYSAECEGLLGGSSVEEGVGQPAGVPQVVMEWMATITGDHVGYPGFQDLGNFFQGEK